MFAKYTKDLYFHSTVDGGGDGPLFIDFQNGRAPPSGQSVALLYTKRKLGYNFTLLFEIFSKQRS